MLPTAVEIVNEIRMTRTVSRTAVLLVEGAKDRRIFRRFIGASGCRIIPCHGKQRAVEAAEILGQRGVDGIVTIVDADFWHIDGPPRLPASVFLTDHHDIEIMILESPALDTVMAEAGSEGKTGRFLARRQVEDLRSVLLGEALPIGILRFISREQNLALKFEGLRYEKIVDRDALTVDKEKLVLAVLDLTGRSRSELAELLGRLRTDEESWRHDRRQSCCGHDVTAILTIGLRKALGNRTKQATRHEDVERWLRLAYDFTSFRESALFQRLKGWEEAHPLFRILDE